MNDGVHTPEHPYCDDLNDWCHTDLEYHASFTHGTFAEPRLPDSEPPTDEQLQAISEVFGIDLTASE
jgi:hypothetical protein